MFSLNVVLTVLLLMGVGYVLYLIKKNRTVEAFNGVISRELSVLIEEAAKVAKKMHKSAAKAPGDAMAPLEDPALLATLLTALVIKYGDMKLGMADFDLIDKEDYISVYVDATSNELLLSINPDQAGEMDPDGIFGLYPKPGDGTFH